MREGARLPPLAVAMGSLPGGANTRPSPKLGGSGRLLPSPASQRTSRPSAPWASGSNGAAGGAMLRQGSGGKAQTASARAAAWLMSRKPMHPFTAFGARSQKSTPTLTYAQRMAASAHHPSALEARGFGSIITLAYRNALHGEVRDWLRGMGEG